MSRITPRRARRLEVEGGHAARVLDFTAQAEGGVILIWHGDDPYFPADGICLPERIPVPPPGTSWDLRCPDCDSSVTTFLGVPPGVAAAMFGVAHSPSCPWLARVVRDGAR
jgi:hypothetical protein